MIKVDKIEVAGFEPSIRGMRNPKQSWSRSDSKYVLKDNLDEEYVVGTNDIRLMNTLYKGGSEHRKYDRMLWIWMDIECSQFWWSEFDTYKVGGTTRNSTSKMHTIHIYPFSWDSFSHEGVSECGGRVTKIFEDYIALLEALRQAYNETHRQCYWRALIEMLPSGYNMKSTVCFNYETAITMIRQREYHKLQEWRDFVTVLKELPYVKEIMGDTNA